VDRYALDANAMAEDFLLERNPSRLLLREARERRIGLLVPEIAFDETVNLYRERVDELYREGRRAWRRLQGLRAVDADRTKLELNLTEVEARYRQDLRATLTAARAEFLAYPSTSHEAVARRALQRRRPFDPEGKDGYRDTLVWESLLEAVDVASPIVLISGDKAAFGKGLGLRSCFTERGGSAGR